MGRRGLTLSALVVLLAALPLLAQVNEYEMRYGQTVEVSVDNLLQFPEMYEGKAVRTKGRLEFYPIMGRTDTYALRGTFGGRLYIVPFPEVEVEWEQGAKTWGGREVEVTGVVNRANDSQSGSQIVLIAIWGFLGPPDEKHGPLASAPTTLEELVTKAGSRDGKMVHVAGQFRGQNLFGDLPSASRHRSADWVLKEDVYAVWVTGKKPHGPGWSLDAGMKRDTGKWLQVTGRVSTDHGVVYIEAVDVTLGKPLSPAAQAQAPAKAPPPLPPRPKKPPVVVFSLPLDGERDVAPNSVFMVQFSKDMDEPSFKGRVVLRYAGRPQPGDRELDAVKIDYDGGRRALVIDPADLLRPGRTVEILLLPGIVDIDGLALETRPGLAPGGVVDTLRFQIAGGGLGAVPSP